MHIFHRIIILAFVPAQTISNACQFFDTWRLIEAYHLEQVFTNVSHLISRNNHVFRKSPILTIGFPTHDSVFPYGTLLDRFLHGSNQMSDDMTKPLKWNVCPAKTQIRYKDIHAFDNY